jgi:hypothetical protein
MRSSRDRLTNHRSETLHTQKVLGGTASSFLFAPNSAYWERYNCMMRDGLLNIVELVLKLITHFTTI